MLHGPCGADNPQAKCMVNRKYSKHFPKEYRERIDWAEDNYLLYARPDNGLVFERNGTRFTNQYVVLHCPQLLLLFDCYINVKIYWIRNCQVSVSRTEFRRMEVQSNR